MNGAEDESVERLRQAYNAGNLTLYLGAGVSVGNGLPTWQQLVLAMYFNALDDAEPRDHLIQYIPPAVGCAFANYVGNKGMDIVAASILLAVVAYILHILKPFSPDP